MNDAKTFYRNMIAEALNETEDLADLEFFYYMIMDSVYWNKGEKAIA